MQEKLLFQRGRQCFFWPALCLPDIKGALALERRMRVSVGLRRQPNCHVLLCPLVRHSKHIQELATLQACRDTQSHRPALALTPQQGRQYGFGI